MRNGWTSDKPLFLPCYFTSETSISHRRPHDHDLPLASSPAASLSTQPASRGFPNTVTVHFDFALGFIIIVTPPLRKADIWKDEIGDGTIHPIRPDATQYDQIRPNYLLFDVSVCSTREVASVVFLDRRSLILSRFPFCTLDNSMSPERGNRRAQQQRLHTTE